MPVFHHYKHNGSHETAPLSHHSTGSDSSEADRPYDPSTASVSKSEGKKETHGYVHSVHDKVRDHGAHAVLHPDEPSFEGHKAYGCRSRPNPDEKILRSKSLDFWRAVNDEKSRFHEKPLYGEKDHRTPQGYSHRAGEYPRTFPHVLTSECLCGKSSRADPQCSEIPIKQVKEHGAYGYSPDQSRGVRIEMSGHRDIYHAHNRHGDIGQYARYRQFQYISVDGLHHLYLPSSSSIPR